MVDGRANERMRQTTETSEDQARLMSAIGGGDSTALAELYDHFERPLYALGMRTLGDRQRAEELVQDTILKVWRNASGFDAGKGELAAWIFTIARRSAVDIIRRDKRVPVPVDASLHDAAEDDESESAWRAWEIALTLSRLPENQRQVVELGVIQGYTHVEIAKRLGVPLGTIKTRIYAGLRTLRTRLEELEILEAGV
jgi:RNA polymerase sigma-70 factor (ECF subfamily)